VLPPPQTFVQEITVLNHQRARILALVALFLLPYVIFALQTGSSEMVWMWPLPVSLWLLSLGFWWGVRRPQPFWSNPQPFWSNLYAACLLIYMISAFALIWSRTGVAIALLTGLLVYGGAFVYPQRIQGLVYPVLLVLYGLIIVFGPVQIADAPVLLRLRVFSFFGGCFGIVAAWVFGQMRSQLLYQNFQNRRQISQLNQQLQAENQRLGAEMAVAQQLQAMLLPRPHELQAVPGLDLAYHVEPANEVGGDYCEVLPGDKGLVRLGIGDVTGHGLESGVLMLMVQTAVRTLNEVGETDPVRFLSTLNRVIYDNTQRMDSDRTLTLSLLSYHDRTLRIFGQHEEVLICRQDGTIERIDTDELGFPLGLERDIAPLVTWKDVDFQMGDVLVLYTDGISEAENPSGSFYGLDRLCEIVRQHRHENAQTLCAKAVADVKQFIATQKVYDDITLIVAKQR